MMRLNKFIILIFTFILIISDCSTAALPLKVLVLDNEQEQIRQIIEKKYPTLKDHFNFVFSNSIDKDAAKAIKTSLSGDVKLIFFCDIFFNNDEITAISEVLKKSQFPLIYETAKSDPLFSGGDLTKLVAFVSKQHNSDTKFDFTTKDGPVSFLALLESKCDLGLFKSINHLKACLRPYKTN